MTRKISEVRDRLGKIGVKRFEEPDGSWYWILTPEAEAAERLEL